jgi:site-specific DNA recombinase
MYREAWNMQLANNVMFIPAKPKKGITPVGIYCRVSSADAAQLESLSAQVSALTNYVASRDDWLLVDSYVEVASSKTGTSRKQIARLIQDCKSGKIKLVIAKSIERMGRDAIDVLNTVRAIRNSGAELILMDNLMEIGFMDDEMILSVVSSITQAENDTRGKNIKMGYQYHAADGTSGLYQRKCYGYQKDHDGNLTINEEEADVVRLIFKLYLSGYSILGIIRELEARKILSPTGKEHWYKGTVDNMLSNEKYIGDVHILKSDEDSQSYLMQDSHQAIIDRSSFQAVQLEKKSRSNVEKSVDGKHRKSKKYSSKKR